MPFATLRVNQQGARAFVLAHATPVERARLESIVGTSPAPREVVQHYEGLQNPDGGFCAGFEQGTPSALAATLQALGHLRGLPPLSGSPMATRALSYVRRNQETDGSWAGHIELTAQSGYLLVTLDPSHLDPVSRADLWLRRQFDDQSVQPPSSMALGMISALWYRLHGLQSPRVAETYLQVSRRPLQSIELAGWLLAALEVGVGGRYLVPLLRMMTRLAELQQQDGSWSCDGEGAVETTLQALRVFRGYDLIEN